MKTYAAIILAALSGQVAADCIPMDQVPRRAASHNFKVRRLAGPALVRAQDYFNNDPLSGTHRHAKVVSGFYLHTSLYQIEINGRVAGEEPTDTAALILYGPHQSCVGTINGTAQQIEDIISDSGGSLKGALQ